MRTWTCAPPFDRDIDSVLTERSASYQGKRSSSVFTPHCSVMFCCLCPLFIIDISVPWKKPQTHRGFLRPRSQLFLRGRPIDRPVLALPPQSRPEFFRLIVLNSLYMFSRPIQNPSFNFLLYAEPTQSCHLDTKGGGGANVLAHY